ncbi:hypothetical protein [Streptomyces sp. NBC_00286]|uniref:hypothetical protein n=1 Tax=Streptomyces sp. NBC_00286 TaxID=2975701 RepID=UPI002E2B62A2|nr:hypothetical protein [Streptomyces sp. NBC_00286]
MLTSHFSRTEWWIAAFVAGLALAVAIQSLILEKKNKWKAFLPPLAAAVFIALDSAVREYEENTPLMLFTATALGLALTRVIFAGHIRRQMELVRSGRPMEKLTGMQTTVFFLTFTAVVAAMAAFL